MPPPGTTCFPANRLPGFGPGLRLAKVQHQRRGITLSIGEARRLKRVFSGVGQWSVVSVLPLKSGRRLEKSNISSNAGEGDSSEMERACSEKSASLGENSAAGCRRDGRPSCLVTSEELDTVQKTGVRQAPIPT